MLAAWFRGAIDPDLEALLRHDVDDLAKYNLLLLMRQLHGAPADAAFLARSLGFHSVERTEAKLAQLTEAGLVRATYSPDDDRLQYQLSDDETARRRLGKLWRLCKREAYFSSLLTHLAERSVEETQDHYPPPARTK